MTTLPHRKQGIAALLTLAATLFAGCDERERLVSVADEKEANRILTVLEDSGIRDAIKVLEKQQRDTVFLIQVPKALASQARRVLGENNLPHKPDNDGAGDAGGSLIPTPTDERLRLMQKTSARLVALFEAIPGVVWARVTVVPPKEARFGSDGGVTPSASVVITYRPSSQSRATTRPASAEAGGESAPPLTDEEIQQMAAASVEGLAKNNVTVKCVPMVVSPVIEGDAGGAPSPVMPGRVDTTLFAAVVVLGVAVAVLMLALWKQSSRMHGLREQLIAQVA